MRPLHRPVVSPRTSSRPLLVPDNNLLAELALVPVQVPQPVLLVVPLVPTLLISCATTRNSSSCVRLSSNSLRCWSPFSSKSPLATLSSPR
jgi:hypothetical protein